MVILVVMALAKESFLTIGNSAKKLILLLKVVNFGHGTGLIASKNTIINIINNF
jgi:hypothetical protein